MTIRLIIKLKVKPMSVLVRLRHHSSITGSSSARAPFTGMVRGCYAIYGRKSVNKARARWTTQERLL